ncbi:E3 ubiquitin-protein ligase MARCHF3-like isoform X2 [Harmonia axyridis]|uniref:E3 ubiquitin-protein ligase MARCHF3-like isoform X2 n=1 Tax=Harmonia axyridis TaxID=115357 RepID=UPI001E278F6F|nr:E3 ubiquitin-protein ligase MARCHF3-like isoform X2 [Harmonia axyridis]
MARKPSTSGASNNKRKDVVVSILLTESTASLMSPKIPNLEDLHSEESHVCTISSSETNYLNNNPLITQRNSFDNKSLLSEVAYFQYGSFSSISMPETSSNDSTKIFPLKMSRPSLPYILKPTKINTRPIVAVRSLAHDDRLDVHMNKIYVSLLDSDMSLDSEPYMCRICHGGESVDDLLTPCRCRGSVALVHLKCLERWLMESSRSYCELCQHHYEIIRQPRYNIIMSMVMFVSTPGAHLWDLIIDTATFIAYTPTAIASTYTLILLCENIAKTEKHQVMSHVLAFLSIFGIAAIDFTYSSWMMYTFQKHYEAWKEFRKNNCDMKLILPNHKMRARQRKMNNL